MKWLSFAHHFKSNGVKQFWWLKSRNPDTSISAIRDCVLFFSFFSGLILFYFPFIFISWRLITLQYCSDFCHTLTWLCSFLKAPIRKLPQMNIFCGFKTKRIYFLRALEDRGLKSKCWQGHTPLEALWTILPCHSQFLMTLSVPWCPWLVATSLPSLPLYSITFSYTSPLLSKDTYYWT